MKIGKRIKEARERFGLTQAELAEQAGLTPAWISHFETDDRQPSIEKLCRIADVLRMSTDALLGRKNHAR